MVNDVKISLTINVEGSTRHYLGKKKFPYTLTKQDLTTVKLPKHIGNKVAIRGQYESSEYVYIPAQIHKNIYRSAFDYMRSDEKPKDYPKKDWKRLTPKQRIAWHMKFIASTYGSEDYSYSILED